MPVHNADVAAVFQEIADLLEIEGANPFRVRAYRTAARNIGALARDLRSMVQAGEDLTDLPGIGADLAGKIEEILKTGTCTAREDLRSRLPPALSDFLKIPGLGPKRVSLLYRGLRLRSLEDLRRAAVAGRIRSLRGFGPKTESGILDALAARREKKPRFKLAVSTQYAQTLIEHLKKAPGVLEAVSAGSFRRARETVGDLDVLVSAAPGSSVMEAFVAYDEVERVLAKGPSRSTVVLRCGLQVDLRVVPGESFGAALHYFTGSKAHNIAIRRLGQRLGLKINEYGVFKGRKRIAGETEESVYRAIGLPYIEPELRENRGEMEAARAGRLPRLVELKDLRGNLHVHTDASDGRNTLEEMARASLEHGLEYIAITDHSPLLAMTRGLDAKRLRKQAAAIDRLDGKLEGLTLLKGIEVDILEDGSLDLPDAVLAELDIVIGAVHTKLRLPPAAQTERILRAMDRPHFTILAHPTGRLIGEREGYDVDMPRIIRKAKDRGIVLELNAQPDRLDLNDVHCQMAREGGVLISIGSDAHSIQDLDDLHFGVGQARRGWLERKDVFNALSLEELRRTLRGLRAQGRAKPAEEKRTPAARRRPGRQASRTGTSSTVSP